MEKIMKNDPFEFYGLTRGERAWRVLFLAALILVLLLDLFIWRP
jgi:hypothetical protein